MIHYYTNLVTDRVSFTIVKTWVKYMVLIYLYESSEVRSGKPQTSVEKIGYSDKKWTSFQRPKTVVTDGDSGTHPF